MQLTTSFNSDESIAPVSIGDSVYLSSRNGQFMDIARYSAQLNVDADAALSIVKHVDKYIPVGIRAVKGIANNGLLFVNNKLGNSVFVCNFDTTSTRDEDKRYAWSKWTGFLPEVTYVLASIQPIKNRLVAVINTETGLFMTDMNLHTNRNLQVPHLDNLFRQAAVATTVTYPVGYQVLPELLAVQGLGCPRPGDYVEFTDSGTALTLAEDMLGGTVFIGYEYETSMIPNTVQVHDEGGTINTMADLRFRNWEATLVDSGPLSAEIISDYDVYPIQEYSGIVSGDIQAITDSPVHNSDPFLIGYKQKAGEAFLRLFSKSWLPLTITQLDWRRNYTAKGRRF